MGDETTQQHSDDAPAVSTTELMAAERADADLDLAGDRLSVGGFGDAAEAAERAIAGYRQLADAQPEVYGPDLASALNLLAHARAGLGDADAAVTAAGESAGLWTSLAADDDAFAPYAAQALADHFSLLDDAGLIVEAVTVAATTVDAYRTLATTDQETYLPKLAQAANNHAVLLRKAGKVPLATATARQAVNLYRTLADRISERYRPLLATALDNLANILSDAGRGRDALPIAREVTALYRELAAAEPPDDPDDDPDRFQPLLAAALNNLAVRLASDPSAADEALAATEEASTIYRRLSRDNPGAHLGNLAGTLANLAGDLAAAGRGDDALRAAREAVDVTRRLAFGNRPQYLPQLAQAVNSLAVRLHEVGRDASAMASAREAVRLYEELSVGDPDRYRSGLDRTTELVTFLAGAG